MTFLLVALALVAGAGWFMYKKKQRKAEEERWAEANGCVSLFERADVTPRLSDAAASTSTAGRLCAVRSACLCRSVRTTSIFSRAQLQIERRRLDARWAPCLSGSFALWLSQELALIALCHLCRWFAPLALVGVGPLSPFSHALRAQLLCDRAAVGLRIGLGPSRTRRCRQPLRSMFSLEQQYCDGLRKATATPARAQCSVRLGTRRHFADRFSLAGLYQARLCRAARDLTDTDKLHDLPDRRRPAPVVQVAIRQARRASSEPGADLRTAGTVSACPDDDGRPSRLGSSPSATQ